MARSFFSAALPNGRTHQAPSFLNCTLPCGGAELWHSSVLFTSSFFDRVAAAEFKSLNSRRHEQMPATYLAGGAAFVAQSQCSAILPLSKRNMSNQVVVYFWPLFTGSSYSRTNDNVT